MEDLPWLVIALLFPSSALLLRQVSFFFPLSKGLFPVCLLSPVRKQQHFLRGHRGFPSGDVSDCLLEGVDDETLARFFGSGLYLFPYRAVCSDVKTDKTELSSAYSSRALVVFFLSRV